ncbi:MAG TPA: ABC transporter substrate-binding protein [candidate division Zixibacteria bacterium]|nr:ABC transporter substrate-binding protein [candidate division Zixibacteria bacterium]
MRHTRMPALGAVLLALVIGACTPGGSGTASPGTGSAGESSAPGASQEEKPTVRIGSQGFYESQLMAEIYAQALENAGYTVERSLAIGTREQTMPAILDGQIDMIPEYIGSLLRGGLGGQPTGDSDETHHLLMEAAAEEGLSVLDYTPAQDTNAFVVRQETADEFSLTTMSDLAAVATELVWGLPPECETNPLCAGALEDAYGIPFAELEIEPLAACDAPIAEALNSGVVDVAELCSTQPAIEQFNFVVLEDDKATQPAENIAPLVRTEFVEAAPDDFAEVLNAVSAEMTTEDLTRLGVEVAVQQRDIAEVAAAWLEEKGLI